MPERLEGMIEFPSVNGDAYVWNSCKRESLSGRCKKDSAAPANPSWFSLFGIEKTEKTERIELNRSLLYSVIAQNQPFLAMTFHI